MKEKPNSSSIKGEIQVFLIENNNFEENYTKKLMLKDLKSKEFANIFSIDQTAVDRGFEAFRLSAYHCLFISIKMIGLHLKDGIRRDSAPQKFSDGTMAIIR